MSKFNERNEVIVWLVLIALYQIIIDTTDRDDKCLVKLFSHVYII